MGCGSSVRSQSQCHPEEQADAEFVVTETSAVTATQNANAVTGTQSAKDTPPELHHVVLESAPLISLRIDAPLPFSVKQQAPVDRNVVCGLVKPMDLPSELQLEQEVLSVPGGITCFLCDGEGLIRNHVKDVSGHLTVATEQPDMRERAITCPVTPSAAFVETLAPEEGCEEAVVPTEVPAPLESPVNAAAASLLEDVSWLLEDEDGGVELYDDLTALLLEDAHNDGPGALVRINLGPEHEVEADMNAMVQTDRQTGQTRNIIRRTMTLSLPDQAEQPDVLRSMTCPATMTPVMWIFKTDNGGWALYDDGAVVRLEKARLLDASFVSLEGATAKFRVDLRQMLQINVSTGAIREVRRLSSIREAMGLAPMVATGSDVIGGINCWVCQGTGKTSKWLSGLEAHASKDKQERPCLVCYGDSNYGLSTECDHFYCKDCIVGSLEAMLNTGQFPAYCPQCRADAGGTPVEGKITKPVLTFLQQRGVISKQFQFRFVVAQLRAEDEEHQEIFECPARCGHFLVKPPKPAYVMLHGKPQLRLGRCPCGAIVCGLCRKQERNADVIHHCEADLLAKAHERKIEEEASAAVFGSIGKKCPGCGMWIQKNEGCDWMMCGDRAHGSLANAIRNGGCGIHFLWSSLEVRDSNWQDLDASGRNGRAVTARQFKNHPKCIREDCPFFKTVDGLGPGIHCHAAVGVQGRSNGGDYCCFDCQNGNGHNVFCHKIRWDEQNSDVGRPDGYVDEPNNMPADRAPVIVLAPFVARHVRLSWPPVGHSPSWALHCHVLGEHLQPLLAKVRLRQNTPDGKLQADESELEFGRQGLPGSNWQVDFDLGSPQAISAVRTDAAAERPFTVHYSEDELLWRAGVAA